MNRQTTLSGLPVIDMQAEPVGKVTDVIYDDRDMSPQWAIVKTGRLGAEHCVPLGNTYIASAGELVVPFDKPTIKRAPKVGRDHILNPQLEKELRDYFGVAA
jgi:sporulation protein YlmC with PRC-barrel domain